MTETRHAFQLIHKELLEEQIEVGMLSRAYESLQSFVQMLITH